MLIYLGSCLDRIPKYGYYSCMNKVIAQERIQALEAEIKVLKTAVAGTPDLVIDDANWVKVKPTAKKVRAKIYKARYG